MVALAAGGLALAALAASSQPGQGTTIKVLFPCSQQPAEELLGEPSGAEGWRSTANVLIVDDEETVRAVLRQMCENVGCTVLTANDGREGIEVFRGHAPEIDLVLLDMTMPHMSGQEAFGNLRRIKPDVRVILISGHNEQEATSRFAGKGLAGFLQKPIGLLTLYGKMQEVLG